MKKLFAAAGLVVSTVGFCANETIPDDRVITHLKVYEDIAVVHISPGFTNSQNCSSQSATELQLPLNELTTSLYSTLLAATLAKTDVGFGIGGCSGQYPEIYRVDLKL